MKKNKKQKIEEKEIVLGKKIREVKINEKQHFLLFVFMLLFFNALLMFSAGFVLVKLNRWYNWVICFALIGICMGLSFKTYRRQKRFHRCELFDNAISINSIWFNIKIGYHEIYEMRVKVSVLDKLFKINTKSLEIKILGRMRKKLTIHFIEENAVKLKQEITMLIDKFVQKQSKEIKISEEKEKSK